MYEYILTISCPDRPGIVAAVSSYLTENTANIKSSAQYGDEDTQSFFMRVHFETHDDAPCEEGCLRQGISQIAAKFGMSWELYGARKKTRLLIMVSQHGHCLNDLLFRTESGALPVEIAGVVSNHELFRPLAEAHALPFYYLPVRGDNKAEQELKLQRIMLEKEVELLVLARYMQVLSPAFCRDVYGRCINIHHSFLPSFSGARPYQQAHERGVKLIGATAHYVTELLDEGPIIEQGVERVDHTHTVEELAGIGRDIECTVLARAVKHHAEHRVLLNGRRTVVLR